jgi:uncharacterized protein YjiK
MAALTGIDLSQYARVGRYTLPEATNKNGNMTADQFTAQQAGVLASGSLLAQEASGVTYNPDTNTLFVVGDGGTSVVQVTLDGKLIDSMTLAAATGNNLLLGEVQNRYVSDPEGIAYLGNGQFAITEERSARIDKFTYAPNTVIKQTDPANPNTANPQIQKVTVGTVTDNIGIEGVAYDPSTTNANGTGFVIIKQEGPLGVIQTNIDFAKGTATNGSAAAFGTNLFDPAKLGFTAVADIYALTNVAALNGTADSSHLVILSKNEGKVVNVDRTGKIFSTLDLSTVDKFSRSAADPATASTADPAPAAVTNYSIEGVTVDKNGVLYVVSENGGGTGNTPELWVYAPKAATAINLAPTAVTVGSAVNNIADKTSTTTSVKVADITVTDDGLGTNNLTLTGTDASSFEIVNNALFVKAGTTIDYSKKTSYNVVVNVDDPTVGTTPDLTKAFTLGVTPLVVTPPANGIASTLIISEAAPWASGNSPYAADWFEVTNTGTTAVDITGWKFDDNSHTFSAALDLVGVTSIGAGKSVVFVETSTVPDAAQKFQDAWFGTKVPTGFTIGTYSGTGAGLSTAGDEVNLYDKAGNRVTGISFGASATGISFENPALLTSSGADAAPDASRLSMLGTNGAFVAANDPTEIGSPGAFGTTINLPVRNDFNGDKKSEILWRNDVDGRVVTWQMNGATVASSGSTSTPSLDTTWKNAGTGDFNGDGKSDILWRNSTTGNLAIWSMNGNTVTSSLASTPTLDQSWKTVGVADFSGDGKADILWRNDDGRVVLWTMYGNTVTASAATSTPTLAASWKAVGTGDFNGDGKSDILWRNDVDGSIALWQMNGTTVTSTATSTSSLNSNWKAAGTGDFNGDGKTDVLWRNTTTNAAVVWSMNGATVTSSTATSTAGLDSTYQVADIADYNGDGKADILWSKNTGAATPLATQVWTMNGASVLSATATSVQPLAGWSVATPII